MEEINELDNNIKELVKADVLKVLNLKKITRYNTLFYICSIVILLLFAFIFKLKKLKR